MSGGLVAPAVIPSEAGAVLLAEDAVALDFVSGTFAPYKFVGYRSDARSCLQKRAIRLEPNQGFLTLER